MLSTSIVINWWKYLPVEINPCYKKSEIKQHFMLKNKRMTKTYLFLFFVILKLQVWNLKSNKMYKICVQKNLFIFH